MSKATAKLIYDTSERSADLYYATHFQIYDAALYLEKDRKKYLVLSDLEIDRGHKEAKVDKILSLKNYPTIDALLKKFKIKTVEVPHNTAFTLVDSLRKLGYKVVQGDHPFYLQRTLKTPQEKKWIAEAQRTTFKTIALAEKILGESSARRGLLHWKGKILSSERLRYELNRFLLEQGYRAPDIIIAGGLQACDPHCTGSGPLKPHQAIIVDIFPRSDKTRFYGDATRTFCRGKAHPELKRQYAVVRQAQEMAISKIKGGVNGKIIHQMIVKLFEKNGFPTKEINGVKQGFIHGTGHGIGLEIHEEPVRINPRDFILKAGHVVTVEPGLYYRKIGGVRIEDIVYVTKKSCELLPTYPKRLEIL